MKGDTIIDFSNGHVKVYETTAELAYVAISAKSTCPAFEHTSATIRAADLDALIAALIEAKIDVELRRRKSDDTRRLQAIGRVLETDWRAECD